MLNNSNGNLMNDFYELVRSVEFGIKTPVADFIGRIDLIQRYSDANRY